MEIKEVSKTGLNRIILDTAKFKLDSFFWLCKHRNRLATGIEQKIYNEGPITFDKFMGPWLDAYYSNAVIGNDDGRIPTSAADFFPPPEYTPVFGFTVAKQILQLWESMDMPEDFRVVEMGAGNGTLAHDILHGFKYYQRAKQYKNDPSENIKYTIVEKNPVLLAKQSKRLAAFSGQIDLLHSSAITMPLEDVTGIFISSELPDAFPVHLVKKEVEGWKELFVEIGDEKEFGKKWKDPVSEVGKFIEVFKPVVEQGRVYPVNIDASQWIGQVGAALKRGYVMTIDYDYNPKIDNYIGTMAAGVQSVNGIDAVNGCFSKAKFGRTDITTRVDFQVLADCGKRNGMETLGYVDLTGFLYGLCFDLNLQDFMKHFPDNRVGDRIHLFNRSERLYEFDASHWNVLMQSKGIDSKCDIHGLQYIFNDNRDGGTSEAERANFHPIKI